MAYELEAQTEQYVDLPLTQFPVAEDTFDRMTDISASTAALEKEYNTYYANGNYTACINLLANNPELAASFFNAEKYNQLRDAVLAMERYLLEEVDALWNRIVQNAIGINDNPDGNQMSLVSYSAEKVQKMYDSKHTVRKITLLADGWSEELPCKQTVNVEGVTPDTDLQVTGVVIPIGSSVADIKLYNKQIGFLYSEVDDDTAIGNGTVTFKAYKKPSIDFTVITEGG